MTIQYAKALIGLCIDEGLKQGVLKNRGEFEELFDYLDKYFPNTGKVINGSSEIPNDLEEAAEEYSEEHSFHPCDYDVTPYDCFIAGAKWQAANTPLPEDTVLFNKGVKEGKRLMMEDAVEGTVYGNGEYTWVAGDIPSYFKYGDKVRIIIVKEDNHE